MTSRSFIEQECQGVDFTSYPSGASSSPPGKQREDVYERDIQQQEEGKGLNRGTPEHLAISDVSISMVTPLPSVLSDNIPDFDIEGNLNHVHKSRAKDKLRLIKAYDVVYASLFTYDHNFNVIKAFCEVWCPLTNTLLTSAGELSISLWDLHDLAGLSMTGYLYDEVVPNALELTGVDESRDRFIPHSSNPKPIKITLKPKKHEDKQVDGGENNPSHALVPFVVIKYNPQAVVTEASKGKGPSHNLADSDNSNKDHHWKRQKKEFTPPKATETSASRSSLADFIVELEDEAQSIDASEESQTSQETIMGPNSFTTTPPLGMGTKRKQLPRPAAVSVFEGGGIIEHVFVKVGAYDEARSLTSEKLSRSLRDQQLKEAKDHFRNAQVKASVLASQVQSAMTKLEHIEKEIVVLKEQRTSCALL
ncbi:UNVERIFIED_CONTAM: hypothetical protein Slati_2405300 [Sesamum latifolium]|uniref:Aminotransferase-like plant mobile domain-containing protein n=1 Tax=Sesamum latifolium TaxID=2727402 RepID=A0AAW2WC80_9LAMI